MFSRVTNLERIENCFIRAARGTILARFMFIQLAWSSQDLPATFMLEGFSVERESSPEDGLKEGLTLSDPHEGPSNG